MYILINMKVDRCPDCNKIISPQETVCSNCGAKLDNRSVKRINSIYHRSNVATFAYLIIFLIAALIYSFTQRGLEPGRGHCQNRQFQH